MNGTDFVAIAKTMQPSARVILISGYSDEEKIDGAIAHNTVHVKLDKPWDNEQLLEEVSRQIEIGLSNKPFYQIASYFR
jgi:response regulator RpfG family c-di-GMP phosphodiesterase